MDTPELALILASVPDALARSAGDLYAVVINAAVNAWMAGHIHGEDSCGHHQMVRLGCVDEGAQRHRINPL
ncbi:hypothetical protein ACFRU3_14215 [Streptomyces sp. NPDC056910]|uniref:hypothetical protein n=1 Tax=Streptomyces sp. NPDC056910 TaxID=3345964 RepID=UPI0036C6FA64